VNAHKAMQDARERGENTFGFFAPSENAEALRELSIESSLRKALGAGELFLVYQPQVDIRTGRIIGVEALLRWEHPEWGVISPIQFIPIAERTGLIIPIGEWVLGVACLQNKIWQKAGFDSIRMAVNLSARQFRQKNLIEVVRRCLVKSALDPSLLELEITEGTAMNKADSTVRILNELKDIGVKISIDDFGTGYSSLSYLKRFPLDVLKIDRTFVKDVHLQPDSQAIARAILAMAKSLNFSVIAEGVEAHEEVEFLKVNGCDALQGYYFSPPIPALDMTRLLEQSRNLIC
jgi:EAL domain-containing protein (putative c-di-GMP-specific phosphodiesterase class I)